MCFLLEILDEDQYNRFRFKQTLRTLSMFIAVLRLLAITFATLLYASLLLLIRAPHSPKRAWVLKKWGQSLCWILGIRIRLHTPLPQEAAILIVNHRSYTDIPVLMGLKPSIFLAKAEVRTWPLIGWAAANAYTVFVDRDSPTSRQEARKSLRSRIDSGLSVLVFSEGTTTPWKKMKPLKPGMFYEAHEAQLPLYCLCLEYTQPDDAWIDDQSLGSHFLNRFSRYSTQSMTVDLYLKKEPLHSENPKDQCLEAHQWMSNQLKIHHSTSTQDSLNN